MPDQHIVYAALDGERAYQMARWSEENQVSPVDIGETVGDFLSYIAGYNDDLVYAISHQGTNEALNVFRKLGALCIACMEFNGSFVRSVGGKVHDFQYGPLPRKIVYTLISGERLYQDDIWGDQSYTVGDYVVLFQYYVERAQTAWVTMPDKSSTLDVIRELAAIAVHVMEDHGVVLREPFEA